MLTTEQSQVLGIRDPQSTEWTSFFTKANGTRVTNKLNDSIEQTNSQCNYKSSATPVQNDRSFVEIKRNKLEEKNPNDTQGSVELTD